MKSRKLLLLVVGFFLLLESGALAEGRRLA